MKRTGTLYRKSLAPSATVRQEVAKAEGAEGKSDTATAQLLTERVATKMLRTTPPAQKAVASASSVLGSFESRLAHPPSQVQASESRVGPMKRAPAHGSGGMVSDIAVGKANIMFLPLATHCTNVFRPSSLLALCLCLRLFLVFSPFSLSLFSFSSMYLSLSPICAQKRLSV